MGRPQLIRGEDIKPGTVVIDDGYNPDNGRSPVVLHLNASHGAHHTAVHEYTALASTYVAARRH
ncbi:hypothetical protein [Streptomyces acidicola]|uniref:hypothetical protein n=1 Tax=Streptomyces acidicola TaxID=2596892 RepID=UPI003F4DC020